MAQVKRIDRAAQIPAATNLRNFRTFLLMAQFEAQEIGARIAQARNEKGLTQEELAEMASFSKRSLQDYEAGETIPYRHFREIGRLLHKPTEWFLYGDPENSTNGNSGLEELLGLVRPGPETENLGPLTVDELRGRFEGLAHIVREQTGGLSEELRPLADLTERLETLTASVGDLDLTLREVVDRLERLEGGQQS